ncbi:hypothetical protein BC835DRAFT_1414996 [Cytidiella melzeri]|nr:hypothetical protein BC835DRAFT_1414996 [Cytidiella melzeri]
MRSSSAVIILADTSTDADSDAISLKTLGTIFSVGAPVVGGIFDHFFKGNSSQRREYEEILARQATDVDSSEAISLKTLGTIFSVGAPIVSGIFDHFFKGNKRCYQAWYTRHHIFLGAPVIGGIFDHFKGYSSQRREYDEDIFARQTTDIDTSDAISLSTLGTIFSVGAPIVGGIFDHFFKGNSSQRRELEELMARSDDMDSGALLTSIISSIPISALQHSLKGGLVGLLRLLKLKRPYVSRARVGGLSLRMRQVLSGRWVGATPSE